MAADGSIIIDARVNNKGAEADLKALQAKAKSTAQQIAAMDKQIGEATNKRSKLTDDLSSAKQQADATAKELQQVNIKLQSAKAKISTLDASKLQEQFKNARAELQKIQSEMLSNLNALEEKSDIYYKRIGRKHPDVPIHAINQAADFSARSKNPELAKKESALSQQYARQSEKVNQLRNSLLSLNAVREQVSGLEVRKSSLESAITQHSETIARLTGEYKRQEQTVAGLTQQRAGLAQQLEQEQAAVARTTAQYAKQQKVQTQTNAQKVASASYAMQKFGTRLTGIIAGALVFNVISSALTKMVGWFGSAMQSSDAFRQSLANLQGAASVAAAPLVQTLGSALSYVINLLATGISYLARFISLLTGKSLSAMKSAARGMNSYGSAASGAAKDTEKATRSLAGFDEITRLDAPQNNTSGSGAASTAPNYDFVDAAGTGLASMAETIGKFLEPLKQIDLTPLKTALQGLLEAAKPLTQTLFAGLEWAWYNLFVPMAQWTVESALPAFLDILAAGCRVLNAALQALAPLGQWLWDSFLQPLASWTGGIIVTVLEGVADALQNVADWISRNQSLVQNIAVVLGSFAAAWGIVTTAVTLWNTVSALAAAATTALGAAVAFLTSPVGIAIAVIGSLIAAGVLLYQNWDVVKAKLSAAWESIRQAASSAWNAVGTTIQNVWNGITGTIKGAVNSIIGFINRMISGLCSGLNSMIGMLNKLKIDVPEGVPFLGGTQFGFNIATLTAPQIPYLAQGAVIPPNREFMAVLGDQSHGTNVEAPLATIQEAVAAVMQDYQDGNLAALGQVLATLREILSAIYGINIGDEVIGQAAARYQTRQSIITGRA